MYKKLSVLMLISILTMSYVIPPTSFAFDENSGNMHEEIFLFYPSDDGVPVYNSLESMEELTVIKEEIKVEILNVENGYTFIRFEQDNNVLEGFIESLYIQTNEQKCNDDDCTDIEDETKFDSKKDSPEKDIENNSDKENNNDDVEGEVSEKNEKTDTKTDTVEKDEEKDEESKNNPNLNREQNDHNVKSLSKAQESLTGYGQKSPTNVYEGRDRDSKVLKSYAMGSNLKYHNYNETWYETSVI